MGIYARMIKPNAVLLAAASMIGLLGGCGESADGPRFAAKDVHAEQVKSDNSFALRMAQPLLEEAAVSKRNVAFSPLSVSFALSMLLNGAKGETREELLALLGAKGITEESLHAGNEVLLDLLQHADPAVEVRIADAIWTKKGVRLQSEFKKKLQTFYAAEVHAIDFSKPAAAQTINRWVSKQTGGHIDQMVNSSDLANAEMVLMNAIYFNGTWQLPFEASGTSTQPFHLTEDTMVNVPMMRQRDKFAHLTTAEYKAVRLPYGSGQWGMIVVLPEPGVTLQRAEETFLSDPSPWQDGFDEGVSDTLLQLPKFTFKTSKKLREVLEGLGMKISFDPSAADFSGMTDNGSKGLFVSDVLQKAFISVDELGTKAAAATKIDVTGSSAPPPEAFEFIADRPFFFAIEDRTTGTLAFLGAVANPGAG
ncbi:serpin family protein [Paenibacillus rhizovicinus]|uniref:Serpin family protein n=1 Tax=Paenibacillus rhizovicinus TaxID=2704463 RepID=A0A6C0P5B2_9BACL|nr:serpin family protein [Paenibacillus rhizovicinus]QHW33730.1 serpin family protein [Paenibacillus rhizovicinus]